MEAELKIKSVLTNGKKKKNESRSATLIFLMSVSLCHTKVV